MRKQTITSLKRKADKLFSQFIIKRDGKCLYCGIDQHLQCAHLYSRKNMTLRWDKINAITLCLRHHLYWAHKEPLEFSQWLENKFPARVKYLRDKNWIITHRKLNDYLKLVEELKNVSK